jgi:hypothetical protein
MNGRVGEESPQKVSPSSSVSLEPSQNGEFSFVLLHPSKGKSIMNQAENQDSSDTPFSSDSELGCLNPENDPIVARVMASNQDAHHEIQKPAISHQQQVDTCEHTINSMSPLHDETVHNHISPEEKQVEHHQLPICESSLVARLRCLFSKIIKTVIRTVRKLWNEIKSPRSLLLLCIGIVSVKYVYYFV